MGNGYTSHTNDSCNRDIAINRFRNMAFDSEKWALSFYGVIDERFTVETDMFQLHIHRDYGIKSLVAKRVKGFLTSIFHKIGRWKGTNVRSVFVSCCFPR